MFRMYLATLLPLVVLAMDPVAQQPPVDHTAMRQELDVARKRWVKNRPAIYEFTISLPAARNPWLRSFGTYRVDGDQVTTIADPPRTAGGPAAPWTSVEDLFNALAENLSRATHRDAVEYDDRLGFPLGAYMGDANFRIVAFRPLRSVSEPLDPFVVVEHANHCGFALQERTRLGSCPTYSVAMWGDGVVSYIGGSGVATIKRREHQVPTRSVASLNAAISDSGFFNLAHDYSSITERDGLTRQIDHSPEKWITIGRNGLRKTVHDFYGAPDVLLRLEQAIETHTDSYRYTKLKRPVGIPDMRRPELVLRPGFFVELPGTALGGPVEFTNDIYGTKCFPLYLATGGSTTGEGRSTNGHVLLWINRAHATAGRMFVSPCDLAAPVSMSASRVEGYVSRFWFEATLVDVPTAPRVSLRRIDVSDWTEFSNPAFCGAQVAFWSLNHGRQMQVHIVDLLNPLRRVTDAVGPIDVQESDMGWGVPEPSWDSWCDAATFRPKGAPARELRLPPNRTRNPER